mmetsp:Transcript_32540/g.74814  ORF Transcript_32540/g.74814 Transcript_32540/m.74814 type:complete len:97 (+) Transcript_32540:486-776(+)
MLVDLFGPYSVCRGLFYHQISSMQMEAEGDEKERESSSASASFCTSFHHFDQQKASQVDSLCLHCDLSFRECQQGHRRIPQISEQQLSTSSLSLGG